MAPTHDNANDATATLSRRRNEDRRRRRAGARPTLVLRLNPRPHISFADDTVDNEHLGRKSSKRCCIYHKKRPFGESSTESSGSDCDDPDCRKNKSIAHKKKTHEDGVEEAKEEAPPPAPSPSPAPAPGAAGRGLGGKGPRARLKKPDRVPGGSRAGCVSLAPSTDGVLVLVVDLGCLIVTTIGTWSEPQSSPSLSCGLACSLPTCRTHCSPSGMTTSSTREARPWGTRKWSGRARRSPCFLSSARLERRVLGRGGPLIAHDVDEIVVAMHFSRTVRDTV